MLHRITRSPSCQKAGQKALVSLIVHLRKHAYHNFLLPLYLVLTWLIFPQEYHLPNQPVHTVDIGLSTYVRRPHPPMNRTQSSPSLYSSNLIRSPLGGRKKSSVSAKVPRPPTDSTTNDAGLPPRPPARGNRRPLEFNPVFSSGSSWRKRK